MTSERNAKDFRSATDTKKPPKAAVDGVAGLIVAFAEISGAPDEVFRALTRTKSKNGGRSLVSTV
jgi:hypothetical protein